MHPTEQDTSYVRLIYNREPHHASHSGYDQLARFMGQRVEMVNLQSRRARVIPARLANHLWPRAGVGDYGYDQFYTEVSVAKEMMKYRNYLFHFLYAEPWYRYSGMLRGMMRGLRGNRLVGTFHYPPTKLWEKLKHREHLRQLDALVVVGSNQIPTLEAVAGPNRVHFVPHGVDTDFYRPTQHTSPQQPPTCLFVGVHLRDFDTLRKTIENVYQRCADVRFVVVTFESNFPQLAGLPSVTLLSGISELELRNLYQHADLLVLPLIDATANNTILEALACGLPIVSTDVGGMRDYLDAESAYLAPPCDVSAMTESILALLEDDELRANMSNAARQKALTFDWRKVSCQLLELYQQLLSN
jgi:glycosyltransferase involved in cell wall biosynthesis